jgi:hypothetical protein
VKSSVPPTQPFSAFTQNTDGTSPQPPTDTNLIMMCRTKHIFGKSNFQSLDWKPGGHENKER